MATSTAEATSTPGAPPSAGKPFSVTPLDAPLGCRIDGVDFGASPGPGPDEIAAIRQAFLDHQLVHFPAQSLDEDALVRLTHIFGEPIVHYVGEYLDPEFPEIMRLSNNSVDGKPLGAPNNGINWHSDQIFRERPVRATLLYGVITPETSGGDTLFSNMYLAWDALEPELRERLEGLQAVHSFVTSYERNYIRARKLSEQEKADNPDVAHPVARTHPDTGRKARFVDPDSVKRIEGVDAEENARLMARLFAHVEDPDFVYRHHWQAGDLVVWDNRCLMHRATGYDEGAETRLMWRTQTEGEKPV